MANSDFGWDQKKVKGETKYTLTIYSLEIAPMIAVPVILIVPVILTILLLLNVPVILTRLCL